MDTEQKQNLMGKIYHCLTMDNPDCATAAQLIDQLLSDPEYRAQEGTGFWLAELSRCLAAQGRYVEAAATMERAIQVGLTGLPDGRADIAAYWLHIGRAKEAGELFAALRDEMPEAVWLYQSAGMAYQAVDRHEEAFALAHARLTLSFALRGAGRDCRPAFPAAASEFGQVGVRSRQTGTRSGHLCYCARGVRQRGCGESVAVRCGGVRFPPIAKLVG